MTYEIKITGSGTAKEIIKALETVLSNLKGAEGKEDEQEQLDDAKWEDETLFTEIEVEE